MKKIALLLLSLFTLLNSYSQCDATFTYSHIDCDSIWFVPVASGSQYTYTWDFGDGGSSASSNPTHVYNADGTYTVILILQDTVANCSNAVTAIVNVNCGGTCNIFADFVASVNGSNCETIFNSTFGGGQGPYTFFWDFGDGTTSNQQYPVHQYPNNSTWTPCLTVTDSLGCDTTVCHAVQVNCTPPQCDAFFNYSFAACDSLFFYPTQQGAQYSYSWDFGDGTNSTQANPGHQYTADGTYQVFLIISDNVTGCTATWLETIVVNCGSGCNVDGAFTQNVDTTNCQVQFVSTAYGGTAPYTYYWDFGDGTSSTSASPSHLYATYGPTWNVCLTITDVNGCDTTICNPVVVDCVPGSCDANFQYTQSSCNVFHFYPASTGNQYQYFWDFGDGQQSTQANPVYTYAVNGSYTVTLYLTDFVAGCSDTVSYNLIVNCANTCTVDGDFTYTTDPNCYTHFTSTAWGGQTPYSYSWNFGDGTTSNSPNPSHYYPNNSAWTPCLTITDANGCDTTICYTLNIQCNTQPCDAQFTTAFATCDSVFFYPVSTGSQYTYFWDFGDGTNSTQMNPGHQYAADGTYLVVLYIMDQVTTCQDAVTVPVTINCGVSNCTTQGAFNAQVDTSSCSVQFISTAFGGVAPYTYFWDFGDGTSSTSASPNHQYGSYGPTWQVCLTITDANGCDTTICDLVVVDCVPGSCDASFQYTYQDCQTVVFYPNSTGAQYAYWWDFGDGQTSTDDNPGHMYSTDGTYSVTLILDDLVAGCSDTVTFNVIVNCGSSCTVNGDFVFNTDPNCYTSFTSTAWGGQMPYTYLWNFGDGTTSNSAHPTHYYPNNTVWTPCLTITDVNGCDTTICQPIQINCNPAPCDAHFTYSFASCDSVFFYPVATGTQYSYSWNFGDGFTSTQMNPGHQYAADGTYSVLLVVTDNVTGCSATWQEVITINCGISNCTVQGAFNAQVDTANCIVQFISTAFGGTAPYSYFWTFGDGTSSTSASPSHVYPSYGPTWNVCLTITDANGCDTTICNPVVVDCVPGSCDANFQYTQSGCNIFYFFPASSGSQYQYYWDFGDGQFDNSSNPVHTYSADGTYTVTLYLTDFVAGCTDTVSYNVYVTCGTTCAVNGDFVYNTDPNCYTIFSATAWGGQQPYTYHWDFGDGTTSNSQSPTHYYPNNSTWTPCLTITDASGCDTTICQSVFVQCNPQPCDASFTYTFVSCDSVYFIPSAVGPQYSYSWTFNDGSGTTSTAANPAHSFPDGSWTVQLVVIDSIAGCGDQTFQTITVNCGFTPCTTDGGFNYYVDSTNCDVQFISTAFGGTAPYTYYWNFGDGTTSTSANPIHSYPNNSVWTPCLTITDANGCDTTICQPIQVNCTATSCDANFQYTYQDCQTVVFYPVSTGAQYTYSWDFGDGSTSVDDNPAHMYTSDGVYVVTLIISDNVSGCTAVMNYSITINCGTSCTANGAFQYSIDPNNCDVHFVSSVWGGQAPYTYFWNFGDGTTSSQANPVHNYPNNSTWTPCLTITDVNGCDTTFCDVVNVQCVSNNCDASFNYTYITCDSVWFIPLVNNSSYDYLWDFGDGTTSTDISPAHTFTNGVHLVVLYLTDSVTGCSNAFTVQLTVNCAAQCDVNGAISWYNDSTSCDVSFISTAFGGQAPYTYYWDFGDGTSSNLANPVHNYPPNTQWTPCLTITDVNGCDTVICEVVYPGCSVGLDEIEDGINALIYPNPSNGQFTIELEGLERVEIYDISGQLVYAEDSFNDMIQINLDFVEDGSYLVRTFANDETQVQQVIKQ